MQEAFAYCAELVRAADWDRFIASLFAPAARRGALHALYAFNVEVSRVRDAAHAALPGEVRLQWWRDVIEGERAEEARANPVAAALLASIERYRLSTATLVDLLEARRFDLYDDPMATLADLETYGRRTSSPLFALAAQILADETAEPVSRPAGVAYAFAGLLRALPQQVARRQLYVPMDVLERHQVRTHDVFAGRSPPGLKAALAELRDVGRGQLQQASERAAELPPQAVPAFLPLATVRAALARLDRSDPFAPAAVPQWRRQWLIWRAARNPARLAG